MDRSHFSKLAFRTSLSSWPLHDGHCAGSLAVTGNRATTVQHQTPVCCAANQMSMIYKCFRHRTTVLRLIGSKAAAESSRRRLKPGLIKSDLSAAFRTRFLRNKSWPSFFGTDNGRFNLRDASSNNGYGPTGANNRVGQLHQPSRSS